MPVRLALALLLLAALAGGVWYALQPRGPAPVWIDLGSLLRHPPGRETLYQYERTSPCYEGEGSFLAIPRFSSYNTQLGRGQLPNRLRLYIRNDGGDLVALVVREPGSNRPLAVNRGRPGFEGAGGRWDPLGQPLLAGRRPLLRLPVSTASARVRVNARAVTCPANLPERRPRP